MRVLLVANTLPPADISGVGEQVLQLAAGLREAGHEVEVLGRGAGGARGPKVLFPLTVTVPFLRLWRRYRPHLVQVHESDGALVALLTAVLAPVARPRPLLVALLQVSYVEEIRAVRPLVFEGRVLGRPGAVERRFRWLKAPLQVILGSLTAWLADVVVSPSAATAREVERDYGVDAVEVLPNVTGGLEPASEGGAEAPARPAAQPAAATAGSPEPSAAPEVGESDLLFVGRLRIRKGVEILLAAIRLLVGSHPNVRLLIAGDGEHMESLRRLARSLEVDSRVLFLGRCGADRVRRLLGTARALVVPSIYEGMPLVVLEAMEAALPVVASRVSGIPEVVTDGKSGWLVPPGDPPRLAAALAEVLDRPDEARRRGEAGRNRLDERFRPRHAVEIWLQRVGRRAEL